jgi:hypothetical protein
MSEYSTTLFAVRDKVAYLTLNRPKAANSLNARFSATGVGPCAQFARRDSSFYCASISGVRSTLPGVGWVQCVRVASRGRWNYEETTRAPDLAS